MLVPVSRKSSSRMENRGFGIALGSEVLDVEGTLACRACVSADPLAWLVGCTPLRLLSLIIISLMFSKRSALSDKYYPQVRTIRDCGYRECITYLHKAFVPLISRASILSHQRGIARSGNAVEDELGGDDVLEVCQIRATKVKKGVYLLGGLLGHFEHAINLRQSSVSLGLNARLSTYCQRGVAQPVLGAGLEIIDMRHGPRCRTGSAILGSQAAGSWPVTVHGGVKPGRMGRRGANSAAYKVARLDIFRKAEIGRR